MTPVYVKISLSLGHGYEGYNSPDQDLINCLDPDLSPVQKKEKKNQKIDQYWVNNRFIVISSLFILKHTGGRNLTCFRHELQTAIEFFNLRKKIISRLKLIEIEKKIQQMLLFCCCY